MRKRKKNQKKLQEKIESNDYEVFFEDERDAFVFKEHTPKCRQGLLYDRTKSLCRAFFITIYFWSIKYQSKEKYF